MLTDAACLEHPTDDDCKMKASELFPVFDDVLRTPDVELFRGRLLQLLSVARADDVVSTS